MGDYSVYRIYAKIDRAYGEQMLERIGLPDDNTQWMGKLYDGWSGRPCEMPADMPKWWGLTDNMRMCYHDIYVDNHNFLNPPDTEVTEFDKQIILHDDHAILDVFFSYKVGYSFEESFKDLAQHLILEEGRSVVFAMVQSEYDFYGQLPLADQPMANIWVASRGPTNTNITKEIVLLSDIRETGFPPEIIKPFPTAWLNAAYTAISDRQLYGSQGEDFVDYMSSMRKGLEKSLNWDPDFWKTGSKETAGLQRYSLLWPSDKRQSLRGRFIHRHKGKALRRHRIRDCKDSL